MTTFGRNATPTITRTGPRISRLVVLVLCALAPTLASAANINVNDLLDNITFAGSQFEFGFSSTVDSTGEGGNFSGSWISTGGTNGAGVVYLLDPGTLLVSDFLMVMFQCASLTGCQATINGRFVSDTTGNLGALPAGFTGVVETGTLQNVTGSFQDPVTHAQVTLPQNLTVFIASDVAESAEVPESASIYLLVGGLLLLLGARPARLFEKGYGARPN